MKKRLIYGQILRNEIIRLNSPVYSFIFSVIKRGTRDKKSITLHDFIMDSMRGK